MDMIIKLLDVIIWPATLLLFLWLFRNQLKQLIPLIKRIKYKNVEIEFTKRLEQVFEDVGELPKSKLFQNASSSKILELIELSPTSAVIESWKKLEITARNKVKQLLPPGETFQKPLLRPLDYLDYKGAIHSSKASAIRELKSLRNEAAHTEGIRITKEDALQYAELTLAIQTYIENIDHIPEYHLNALTILVLKINHMIDSKKYDNITIENVYTWIDEQNIFKSLIELTAGDEDFSFYLNDGPYANFVKYYEEKMYNLYNAYGGDHDRKWGVKNLGLCLLLAWTNELIQQGTDWRPSQN